MITFREFLNKKDDKRMALLAAPAPSPGLQVVSDLSQDLVKPQRTPTTLSVAKPALPSSLLGARRPSDRPLAKKPTDFLARKGSSFRKSF